MDYECIPIVSPTPTSFHCSTNGLQIFPYNTRIKNLSRLTTISYLLKRRVKVPQPHFNLSGIDITGNVYQWRKNGVNLSNGGRISGANSHTLVISTIDENDAGEYTLRITNTNAPQLTESISQPITLRIGDVTGALEAPGIVLPKSNPDDDPGSIQLQWTSVDGADMYRIQTATATTFPDNGTVTFDGIAENNLIVEDLEYETTYYYRVMAYNDSQQSPWSATGDFTTGSPRSLKSLWLLNCWLPTTILKMTPMPYT
jgi:hypothetical protein